MTFYYDVSSVEEVIKEASYFYEILATSKDVTG